MWSSYFRFWRPLPPPPHKISNNILIYLISYKILALPLPVIKIVKYCGVWESGGGGGGKILQKVMAPSSLCH